MGVDERDSIDEREAIVEQSTRVFLIALAALPALVVVFFIALAVVGMLGGRVSYREAYDRCTSTPPGLPTDVDVTHVLVRWSWVSPFGYECIYDGPQGEESYPASASCLTDPGWCRKGP